MTPKEIVFKSLKFESPAYVPWAWHPTVDCGERLKTHLGVSNLDDFIGSHFFDCYASAALPEKIDADHVRDAYGVTWDVSVDKDIGTPSDWPIKQPSDLDNYRWPDMGRDELYAHIPPLLARHRDKFTRYLIGFSLFERSWTMFGMENLLMAMIEQEEFVERFYAAIADHNLVQVRKAIDLGVDCVHFGDDYGMQVGLIMGASHWRRFIKPQLARMFEPVRKAGKFVSLHSCGAVAELFDDLVEIGLNMFNPFQPEVMDVFEMKKKYHGRLAFHGGLSIQKVLPFGSVAEVRQETRRLIEMGRQGGYVLSPSHQVPRDVPPENLVAMMEELRAQNGR